MASCHATTAPLSLWAQSVYTMCLYIHIHLSSFNLYEYLFLLWQSFCMWVHQYTLTGIHKAFQGIWISGFRVRQMRYKWYIDSQIQIFKHLPCMRCKILLYIFLLAFILSSFSASLLVFAERDLIQGRSLNSFCITICIMEWLLETW